MVEMIRTAVDLEMRTNQSHLGLILDYRGRIACLSAATLRYVTRWRRRFEDWKFGAEAIPATEKTNMGMISHRGWYERFLVGLNRVLDLSSDNKYQLRTGRTLAIQQGMSMSGNRHSKDT
jgi:hypothetical protein